MEAVKVRGIEIGAGMPKICVPVTGITNTEILTDAREICKAKPDLVEWRADWYEDINDPAKVNNILRALRETLGDIPLLFTFRTKDEGGRRRMNPDDYVELNQNAVRSRQVDLVDVELFTGETEVLKILVTAHEYGVKTVLSNHDFEKTPSKETIISRLCRMQELGADIMKIAVMPQNRRDVLTLLSATEEMNSCYAKRPLITMSMAEEGRISRMCGEVFGSAVTFGAVGKMSAPGQIGVEELRIVLEVIHGES